MSRRLLTALAVFAVISAVFGSILPGSCSPGITCIGVWTRAFSKLLHKPAETCCLRTMSTSSGRCMAGARRSRGLLSLPLETCS